MCFYYIVFNFEFTINTEPNDSTPEEIFESLKSIFNQK